MYHLPVARGQKFRHGLAMLCIKVCHKASVKVWLIYDPIGSHKSLTMWLLFLTMCLLLLGSCTKGHSSSQFQRQLLILCDMGLYLEQFMT